MKRMKLYINGEWVDGLGKEYIDVENPATNEIIAQVPRGNKDDVDKAAIASKNAFKTWQFVPVQERISLMKRVIKNMKENRERLVKTVMDELGSPYKVSSARQVDPYLNEMEAFCNIARDFPYEVKRNTTLVRREPIGVVGALTPWNFPLCEVEKKVIPAILAGCCVILKPSQVTPLTAYILAECIDAAGIPKGVFNLVTGAGSEVGNAIASHEDVDMISFTGSTDAGREVARLAMVNIKRIMLELGGKSASVILHGANHEIALNYTLNTVFLNSGQTCNATTRLLVPRDELAIIEKEIIEKTATYVFGKTDDPNADIATLASRKQFDKVKSYIEIGIEEDARVLLGEVPADCKPGEGYYIKPFVFTDVNRNMRIAKEEIFGPVLVVIPYDTVEEAVEIANDSIYGLGGAVFGPQDKATDIARLIRTGTIFVNDGIRDHYSTFGGYKQSGIGREGGLEGFSEFLEVKSIFVNS